MNMDKLNESMRLGLISLSPFIFVVFSEPNIT
jgi:hypothetical protein